VSAEAAFIAALRGLATDPAARGLLDDAAVLEVGGTRLVLTHDAIAEGIHYRSDDPPEDVAWKLVAVNLSDLAAKGARPVGVLLGYTLGEAEWDQAFLAGLGRALAAFDLSLLGGDTVKLAEGAPRTLSLTAIGEAAGPVPSRAGAAPGDDLWVSGTIGDAGAGLAILQGALQGDETLIRRYRAPRPRLEAGQALAQLVSAMMDVSDGLLIDATRLGHASGVGLSLELDHIPLSDAYMAVRGDCREARLRAATAGDDYELLFAAAPEHRHGITEVADRLGLPLTRIGSAESGAGLALRDAVGRVPLPERLGWEHERG
jgi:thiamine-monophosphate kinase